MANPISTDELQKALSDLSWEFIEEEVKVIPPYLQDWEVTAQRLREKHPERFKTNDAAGVFLDKQVSDGKMTKELRKSGQSGSRVWAYAKKEEA